MKNFKIIALIMLAGTMLFSSCAKDEDETAAPTLAFSGDLAVEFDPIADLAGKTIVFSVSMTAEAEVSAFSIMEKKSGLGTETEGTYDAANSDFKGDASGTYYFDKKFMATDFTNGTDMFNKIEYIFTLTDKEDRTTTKTFTVDYVMAQAGVIETHAAVTIGSWTASEGSYYVSASGMVYKQSEVAGHETEIDFVFYAGSDNGPTLAAPSDAVFQTGGELVTNYVCKDWSTKNATKFGSAAPTQLSWSSITTDALIIPLATNLTATDSKHLAVGNIIPFETSAGKKGVIKVNAVDATVGSGSITIEVKVQE